MWQANGADIKGGTWFETGAEMLNGGTLNYFAVPWGIINNPLPLFLIVLIEVRARAACTCPADSWQHATGRKSIDIKSGGGCMGRCLCSSSSTVHAGEGGAGMTCMPGA